MAERTFVMIKPDGVCRGLVGDIIGRFERSELKVVAARMEKMRLGKAEELYAIHKGKPFYDELVAYATSDPVMLMVLEGNNAVAKVREVIGATDPAKAAPGSVRADHGISIGKNTVHASDSPENAANEIAIFFKAKDIVEYEKGKYVR